ncbi:hypothetical protein QLQ12_16295 [Actinoplanes sp. NEAU-A12]|uniref:Uncharacterized protein n=1 Tax=Actinoplanes sandaracinus TaxID=3045177 RepID=A0ABT6WKA2_9ACTN|nr:hypothetical protein [Actinoplanes sandaracinus]MDI6100165.1 hypothetical protein [Actinoplanes sandaracinus]
MTQTAQRAAAGWAAGYGTLALVWAVTGRGYPYGPAAPHNDASVLRAVPADVGAPVFAAVLLTAAVALIALGPGGPRRPLERILTGYLWVVAAALLLVVPDVRLLTVAGYLPVIIGGLPFGWPPIDYGDVFTWTLANEALAVAGGVLIARAVLRRQRHSSGACVDCGRTGDPSGWTAPAAAARWGRAAAWTAAVIPALYAAVRLAWAAGYPLGITPEFLAEMRRTGLVWAGAGLGVFALAGAVLTLGLTQRWGERFPRWMPWLGGRTVPIRLATVPAAVVAVFVWSASVSLYTGDGSEALLRGTDLLSRLPMLLWPLWSVALGAAAYGYHLRRRPPCEQCGNATGATGKGLVHRHRPSAY